MSWKEALISYFENLDNYKGRACRSEFWWFQLTWFIAMVIVTIFQILVLEGIFSLYKFSDHLDKALSYIAFFASMSVGIRRMHDTNRSGIWLFMPLITWIIGFGFYLVMIYNDDIVRNPWKTLILPVIFSIVFLVFAILPGDENENRFGINPLSK